MRLVFDRNILLSALEKICSIAGVKSTFAILSYFLIEVKSGVCTFTATDMNDIIQIMVEANVDEDCSFLLKAKETLDLIKGLPKGEILFEPTSMSVKISCDKFRADMNMADKAEYPNVVISDVKACLNFKSFELKNALSQVAQFVSTDNSRPEFCGIHFNYKFENKKAIVTMVSTDGHRLSKTELLAEDLNASEPNKDGYILSAKASSMLSNFFSEEKNILFSFESKKSGENKVIFKGEKITVVSTLISGRYPSFSSVIPQTFNSFIVNKSAFISSLKRSFLFNPKQPLVRIKLSENNVNIYSSGQMGSMSDDVECKYIGDEMIIGLNAKYLQESLSIVDDLFSVVGVVDADSPIVVMSETDFDAKNFGTLSVIMPMMI